MKRRYKISGGDRTLQVNDIGLCVAFGMVDVMAIGIRQTAAGRLQFVFDLDSPVEHLDGER